MDSETKLTFEKFVVITSVIFLVIYGGYRFFFGSRPAVSKADPKLRESLERGQFLENMKHIPVRKKTASSP
jgi:hypothetical protein